MSGWGGLKGHSRRRRGYELRGRLNTGVDLNWKEEGKYLLVISGVLGTSTRGAYIDVVFIRPTQSNLNFQLVGTADVAGGESGRQRFR